MAQKGSPYQGPPVDAWSCGVVLFVLLVGNTPWDEPTSYSREYKDYKSGSKTFLRHDPWRRISPDILCTNPVTGVIFADIYSAGVWTYDY